MHSRRQASAVIFYLIFIIATPTYITFSSVLEPLQVKTASTNPTPFGYTLSLGLFVFPILGLGWWFMANQRLKFQKRAFWLTILILTPTGFILDLLFGNYFFVFPNHYAITGITIPAIGGDLPIEVFVFYISGFMTVLLIYIWCDEFWMEKYNISDYQPAADKITRIINFNTNSFMVALVLIGSAIIYRRIRRDSLVFYLSHSGCLVTFYWIVRQCKKFY